MSPGLFFRRLESVLLEIGPMVVGFSAGVDSTLLLKAAFETLGAGVVGITTVSPSFPAREKAEAEALVRQIGVRHRFVLSGETEDPAFAANGNRRCFFCKSELFRILRRQADELRLASVAYGAQKDDLGEFRPGMEAARQFGARAPLLEAGLGKAEIRELSRWLGLPTWNKPAMACLSSRIPHGTPITAEDLKRVERAEEAVRAMGFRLFRVRARGTSARVEIAREEMPALDQPGRRHELVEAVESNGYLQVTIDPQGYRPGGGSRF